MAKSSARVPVKPRIAEIQDWPLADEEGAVKTNEQSIRLRLGFLLNVAIVLATILYLCLRYSDTVLLSWE